MLKMFKPNYLNNYRDKADKHLTTNKHYLFILLYKNYELLFKRYESSGGGANFSLCPPPPPANDGHICGMEDDKGFVGGLANSKKE